MGCYINKVNKEDFLNKFGKFHIDIPLFGKVSIPSYKDLSIDGNLPVVLVDNGPFTAAAVAFDEIEYNRFTREDDGRPRQIWTCKKDNLLKVVDCPQYLR